MFGTLLIFISSIITIAWSIPFILTPLFGLQFYIVSNQKVIKLLKKLPTYSSLIKNEESDGWVIGYPFIGYIFSDSENYSGAKKELYIFTTRKFFDIKMREIESNEIVSNNNIKPTNIKLFEREGTYTYFSYSHRQFNIQNVNSRIKQEEIILDIVDYYNKNMNSIVIIHGEKGVGKSMIPLLLAKFLSNRDGQEEKDLINFCDTYNPTDPGDNFTHLYNCVCPTKESPLIIVFEEFDIMINNIHYNKLIPHKNSPTLIRDKASWNQFFDRFDRKYYPWTILIMTSNSDPNLIVKMDPTYIREGRVNQIFHLTQ
jgi:hypothetical protein